MIIKVMTRKEPTFRQLIAYVMRDAKDARYLLTHNLLGSDADARAAEFEANARLLRKHQNGTVMFHDILSITRSKKLGLEQQKAILKDIVQDYIRRRAPGHLVFAGLHDDHAKHLHYHLVISANAHGDWKRAHLSKPQLRQLQIDMEARVLRLYPDLEQQAVMSRRAKADRLTQQGQELKRRTGKVPERQRVVDAVTAAFAQAQSRDDLFRRLTDARLELYRRGKAIGVRDLDTGRNHRLATLGLSDAFTALSTRIETAEQVRLVQHHAARVLAAPQASPAIQVTPQAAAQPIPQKARQQASADPSTAASNPTEQPMNIFEAVITAASAAADALSITTDTGKPLTNTASNVKTTVHRIATTKPAPAQAAAKPPSPSTEPEARPQLTEAERQAAERMQEMADLRQSQQDQLGDQRGSSLKR